MLRQAVFANARALRPAARVVAPAAVGFLRAQAQAQLRSPALAVAAIRRVQGGRWYSAEAGKEGKEEQGKEKQEGEKEKGKEKEDEEALELKKKLEVKDREVIDVKDKYLRLMAEFRTLQDRTVRDKKAAREFAIQKFATDLCDSVDNLDRALAGVPHEKLSSQQQTEHLQDLVNLYEGLKLTESMLMQTLKNHGIERFDPAGEKFNANEHEVTVMVPHPEKDDNTVVHVERKGFKLNGRLLRAAKVQVAKNLKKATS